MGQPILDSDKNPILDSYGFPLLLSGPLFFPVIPSNSGMGFPVGRAPTWDTLVQNAYSGKKTSLPRRASAIYEYTVDLNLLRIKAPSDYQAVVGFVNSLLGQFASFYYDDPNDDAVTGQLLAVGDGATSQYQLYRTYGYANDIVQMLRGDAPILMDNGVPISPGGFTIDNFGEISLTSPLAAGHVLSWTGGYYWLCQMTTDKFALMEIESQKFELKKLTFETILL